jgi:hypothetical protein
MFKRFIVSLSCLAFILCDPPLGFAQNLRAGDDFIHQLPGPGSLIEISPSYMPLTLKGLVIHPQDALKFDFLMDTGKSRLNGDGLHDEALKIMKYFLTALTIPENDMWVNLSPYEKGRIVQKNFGRTVMGRDLLAEDYVLKQLTASVIYPENALGKEFWSEVYRKAGRQLGTTLVPVNTFNKVWIVPDRAVVWERGGKVIIVESRLKVMLEEDYLSAGKHHILNEDTPGAGAIARDLTRRLVLPVLEKEVNEGRNFSQLRQMYQAMILAAWYKKALRESIINKVYADRNKIRGVDDIRKDDVETIYRQYLKAFKRGTFNYIKEDIDQNTGDTVPRKYFSGGFSLNDAAMSTRNTSFAAAVLTVLSASLLSLSADNRRAIMEAIRPNGRTISVNADLTPAPAGVPLPPAAPSREQIVKGYVSDLLKSGDAMSFADKLDRMNDLGDTNYLGDDRAPAMNMLLGSLGTPYSPSIEATLRKLGASEQDIIEGYRRASKSNDRFIQKDATQRLGMLQDKGALKPLLKMLGDENFSYIEEELGPLQPTREDWIEGYLGALDSVAPKAVVNAIEKLGVLAGPQDRRVTGRLLKMLGKGYVYILSTYPDGKTTAVGPFYKSAESSLKKLNVSRGRMIEAYRRVVETSRDEDARLNARSRLGDLETKSGSGKDLGGIALDSGMLDLQIKRDKNGVALPLSRQPLGDIQGFLPRIISINPVDLSGLMGILTEKPA